MTDDALLQVSNLQTYFRTEAGTAQAVDGVSFSLFPNQTLAIVGESGCGKSVTSMSIMRLLQAPPAYFPAGTIHYKGKDILHASEKEMQKIRGGEIAMIFQEPMTSLNPVFTIGEQIVEAILLHQQVSTANALDIAEEAAAERHPVQAADQLALAPDLDRVAEPGPEQLAIGGAHRGAEPGAAAFGARRGTGMEHGVEGAVEAQGESAASLAPGQRSRAVEGRGFEHGARVRRPPEDRFAGVEPGKDACPIGLYQTRRRQVAASGEQAVGFRQRAFGVGKGL